MSGPNTSLQPRREAVRLSSNVEGLLSESTTGSCVSRTDYRDRKNCAVSRN